VVHLAPRHVDSAEPEHELLECGTGTVLGHVYVALHEAQSPPVQPTLQLQVYPRPSSFRLQLPWWQSTPAHGSWLQSAPLKPLLHVQVCLHGSPEGTEQVP
jgi:hypothetical protein